MLTEKEIKALQDANEKLKNENAAVKASNAEFKTASKDLVNKLSVAEKNVTKLTGQITELEKNSVTEITRLSTELGQAKAIADVADPTIKVGGESYSVIGKKFTYKAKTYTLDDLLKDTKLQEELVAAKMGFLKKKA